MRALFCRGIFLLTSVSFANEKAIFRCDLSDREKLNKNSFDHCSQKKLDAFYKELRAGSIIPDGSFDGKVHLARESVLEDILSGIFNEPLEAFMERLWRGKTFYRQNPNKAILFNRIAQDQGREAFPAHVYYGQSLFDPSRLSVVIDYKYNQNIEGYDSSIDWLVNEEGLAIRDEVREVRKNLYLGRAYAGKRFLLNFVLERTKN